jgi:lipopolysaccharide export LptBFGC system permease protein LptF
MSLISRHLLRSLAAPFFWGVLALTGLLLLNSLATLIDTFGGKGLGLDVMVEAIVLALPALLTLTLPMSVLVATLYAYSTLAADSEMVAMYANGISVWRMVRPALLAAVVVAAVNFLLFDQLVPISNTRFKTLRNDVYRKTPNLTLRPQQLNEFTPAGYILRAREIEPEGGMLREVSIWDLRRVEGRRAIHADSGVMATSADGTDLLITLHHGEILDFSISDPTRVERTAFRSNRVTIENVQRDFERSEGQVDRGDRERSGCELLDGITESEWLLDNARGQREQLTRRDLRHLAGLPPAPPPPVQPRPEFPPHCGKWRGVERFLEKVLLPGTLGAQAPPQSPPQDTVRPRRLRFPQESIRIAKQLGRDSIPKDSTKAGMVTPDQGAGPFFGDSTGAMPLVQPQGPPTDYLVDPQALPGAARSQGMASSILEVSGARVQATEALRISREFAVEYHKKFAIPLGSFCFVLMGVALALKYPQSGIGLVIGGSLVIFMTFYVLLIGGENLADKGVVSAEVAMYAPVALFTLAGALALASTNREMGSGRGAGLFDALRDLWHRRKRGA